MIGIVGGMGPRAGLDLAHKVMELTPAQHDHEHLPTVLASLPRRIPDRAPYLRGETSVNPAEAIADILGQLDHMGVTVAAIPCVTAHSAPIMTRVHERIREDGLRLKLLSFVEETIAYIQRSYPAASCIGSLSTTATIAFGVLTKPLVSAGFTAVVCDSEMQSRFVNETIYDHTYGLKADADPVTDRAREQLQQAVRQLSAKGADAIILGCTELPLALPEAEFEGVPLIDPTHAVALALIHHATRGDALLEARVDAQLAAHP
ncbi:MAG: amino acid racemase [Bacteroidota bacterium]